LEGLKRMAKAKRRGPGRPQKYPTGRRSLTIRISEPLCQAISKVAEEKGYSISEEIESRLNEHAKSQELKDHLDKWLEKYTGAVLARFNKSIE
jgi:hypothetical protein